MTYAVRGFAYEDKIYNMYRMNKLINSDFKSAAGSNNNAPDLELTYNDKKILVELKLDSKAQSGGTSILYSKGSDFSLLKESDSLTNEMVNECLADKRRDYDSFLDYFGHDKFTFSTSKAMWNQAVKDQVVRKTNTQLENSTKFIEEHYNKKGVYYINFGDKGLFYMGEDKFNLGVPKLNGKVNLEIRARRSGSRKNKEGIRVCSVSIRIQGRLKKVQPSPFRLENVMQIKKVLRRVL